MQAQVSTGAAGGQRVSSLREKMLTQMTEKGLAEATREAYVRGVLGLAEHCDGRRPEAITHRSCGNRHCVSAGTQNQPVMGS